MTKAEKLIKGLELALKYDEKADISAEHDVIYAGPDPAEMSEEDIAKMREWGWHEMEEYDCWAIFT